MVEPKKAVVCVVMRENGEVLMGRRNDAMRFMGGHHVFPGGRIDEDEGHAHVVGARDLDHARAIHAAVREVFEETGLLCVSGTVPNPDILHEHRIALLEGNASLDELLATHSLSIQAEHFEEAGSWLTPSSSPIRFDTQYYFYHHRDDTHAGRLIEGEMTSLDWLHPALARERWHRGEIKIPSPVSHTLFHLDASPHPDFFEHLRRTSDRTPGVPLNYEIHRGIRVVPLLTATLPPATHTNCVLIGEDEILIVDPGAGAEEELTHLYGEIDQFVSLGSTVKGVLLTHSHVDHVEGACAIRDRYNVPIIAHELTEQQVDFSVDEFLGDGEVIELSGSPGWRIRAVHTPGHDPGHLALFEETTRSVLAGDMVANPGTIIVSESFGGNMQDFMDSLTRLSELDAELLIPAHGLCLDNPREVFLQNRAHRQWREDKVKAALDEGHATIKDLLEHAYDDAPQEAIPLAEHSLKAILSKLGVSILS